MFSMFLSVTVTIWSFLVKIKFVTKLLEITLLVFREEALVTDLT